MSITTASPQPEHEQDGKTQTSAVPPTENKPISKPTAETQPAKPQTQPLVTKPPSVEAPSSTPTPAQAPIAPAPQAAPQVVAPPASTTPPVPASQPAPQAVPTPAAPPAAAEENKPENVAATPPAATPAAAETPATAAASAPTPQPEPTATPATAKKKVLIVEDTVELGEVIQATLERMNIQTYHETHGAKAIDLFKANRPDLVLLDIGLPDMIGWKLLDSLKELDKENRPRVIVITAYGDPANRLMGKLQDVDSYLIKPFTPDEVERLVTKVLNLKGDTPPADSK